MTWKTEAAAAFGEMAAVFGVLAQWTDGIGRQHTANVLFVEPAQDILSGMQITSEYGIDFDPASLPGIKHGNSLTVDGIAYTVREILAAEDGITSRANLKR